MMISTQLLSKIWTLSPLDHLLNQHRNNRDLFILIFDRKQTILKLIQQNKLDAKKYMKLSITACKSQNPILTKHGEQDLRKLKGNRQRFFVQDWFNAMIENAKLGETWQIQQYNRFKDLQEESKVKTTVQEVQKSLIVIQRSKIESIIQQNERPLIDQTELVSFRAFDSLLSQYQDNYEFFERIFDRKARVVSLIEKKVITPQRYKAYLEQYINNKIKNKTILQQTKKEYQSLSVFHSNKIQSWFKEIYQSAKQQIEQQKQKLVLLKYSQLSNVRNRSQPFIKQNGEPSQIRLIQSTINLPKNRTITLSSLKALDYLLRQHKENSEDYAALFKRKRQVFDELKQGKINAQEYYLRQKVALKSMEFGQMRNTIIQEISLIRQQFNEDYNQWIKFVMSSAEESYEQQKKTYHSILAHRKDQKRVEQKDKKQKIYEFLKAMAVYQCLLYQFKRHKINLTNHNYLIEYENTKRFIHQYIENHQKDPSYDISKLTNQLFPPLNDQIFYSGQLEKYKQSIRTVKSGLQQQKKCLANFRQQMKRVTSSQNLEKTDNQIADCEKCIQYLNEWPHGEYQPFPLVTSQKVTKISVDINNLQANQVQVEIIGVDGIDQEHILDVHLFESKQAKHSFKVISTSEPFRKMKFKEKLSQSQLYAVVNGTQSWLGFKLSKKGFFGILSQIGEKVIKTAFFNINTDLITANIEMRKINCIVKVQSPRMPIQVELTHFSVKTYPTYKHDPFIQEQFIKKLMPYSNPSPSEIIA